MFGIDHVICDPIQYRKLYLHKQSGGRGVQPQCGAVLPHMTEIINRFSLLCGHRFQLKFAVSCHS
jgi:hypothetical protein